ncbi:MAG: DUF2835 domain-containing protein [Gammaproteobacteria bacterium]|jgi:hypothetical protein|nr:DUF2835 domain-containing protein [Gammaproteobacteria bacterium]MBT3723015.1 DUF2835 domain-containing protein [Gammaproteobacteria bacterium]MBT4076353.1 DUF2835 domain-containing protein [Gammaproteobacteria bacterium]MBT4196458.1 DUF2835 domain-containing protein [Gammaproteobacteria bacterium]MBT4448575.1 DUF2835 domain-containing protein [Gammaproteobacteria bacterium]
MQKLRFKLNISAEKLQAYYRGLAKFVAVQSEDGRNVQFPVSELQPFVSHSGVQGRFEIQFTDEFKFLKLTRL